MKTAYQIREVSFNDNSFAIVSEDDCLYVWGNFSSSDGKTVQYIDNTNKTLYKLTSIVNSNGNTINIEDKVKHVSFGSSHYGIVMTDGSFLLWGDDSYGQLGDGHKGLGTADDPWYSHLKVTVEFDEKDFPYNYKDSFYVKLSGPETSCTNYYDGDSVILDKQIQSGTYSFSYSGMLSSYSASITHTKDDINSKELNGSSHAIYFPKDDDAEIKITVKRRTLTGFNIRSFVEGIELTDAQKKKIVYSLTGPDEFVKQTKSLYDFVDGRWDVGTVPAGTYTIIQSGADFDNYDRSTVFSGYTNNAHDKEKDSVKYDLNYYNDEFVLIKNSYTPVGSGQESKGTLRLNVSFDDSTPLTDAEKNAVTYTVTGPQGFTEQTKKYGELTNGVWDLGEIPVGTYAVTQTGAGKEDYLLSTNYELFVGDAAEGTVLNKPVAFDVASDTTSTVKISNSYAAKPETGTLKIVATFDSKPETKDKNDISFTVTGPNDYSETVPYSGFTNDACEIKGLAVGEYTVTESGAGEKDYDLTTSFIVGDNETNKATITKDATVTMTVAHKYVKKDDPEPESEKGTLKIVATFDGKPETKKKDDISFTVTGPNNYSDSVPYSRFTNDACEIKNLAVGEYTVTESGADDKDYNLTTSFTVGDIETNKATVTKDATVTMTVAHKYVKKDDPEPESEKGTLKIVATFDGKPETKDKNDISFTVTGPNDYSETVPYSNFTNDACEIKGLAVGEYTVTESGANDKDYDLTTSFTVGDNETNKATVTKDATVTMTVAHKYVKKDVPEPEPEKGTLKVTASFDDLLTNAEKDNVTFTVSGPKNFESLTKEYREFKNGIWDLGEVVTGEYTITETNIPDKKNYILKKTFNGKEANESIISVKKNAVSTIDIVNSFIFDHIDITDSDVKLLTSKYAYNGKNIKPVPIITVDGISLKQGIDYTVKYKAKCKKIGKHTLTIEGKGRYRGKITKSYSIFLDTLKYKLKVTKDLGRSVVVISPKNLKPTKANKCKFQVKIFKDKKLKKKWCNKIPPITYKTFDKTKFVIDSSNKFKFNKGKKYYIIIRVINGKKQSKWSKVKVFKGKG